MVRCVQSQPACTVYSVLRLIAVQNILCWLACFVHNGPPSPKFQYSRKISTLSLTSLWGQPKILYTEMGGAVRILKLRWRWSVVYKASQPAQKILYCDQSQYRICCAGWLGLYTTDHLHLSFKSSPASPGRRRAAPPIS